MFHRAISQCSQNLKSLETCFAKAEQFAAARKFDSGLLVNSRLAPDMQPFAYQVQSACDYIKGAAAWLSGRTPPQHEDNEKTFDELRARIEKTVAFVEGIAETEYSAASARNVRLSWAPGKQIGGEDYLLQVIVPNVYFHLSIAYAILRHNGVEVGKMDFLGPMNFVDS